MHWQKYQSEVERVVASLGSKPQNVLVFYGQDGIGKKELCDSIFKSLKSQHLCALLDGVEIGQSIVDSLAKAVLRLRQDFNQAKANFTCFDLAYLHYLNRVDHNPPQNAAEFSRRMNVTEIGGNLAELINSILSELEKQPIPIIQPLTKLAWLCMTLSNPEMWEWYKRSKCRERLEQLTNYVRSREILQQLPLFLLADLGEYLKHPDIQKAKQKAVILIDTYQDLADDSGRCKWLDELIAQSNPHVLWVIFSKRALNFTENTHNIPILPLTAAESQVLLQQSGVNDEEIRQIIIQAAGGIPFYLQLGIETWQKISQKRPPQPQDFAQNLTEVLRQQDAAWEMDERRMWQVLSHCRTWDAALFTKLMVQFQLDSWQHRLSQVTASPYVEEVTSGVWRLHPLMQQHLQENQSEDLGKLVNSWLFEHYQAEYQQPDLQITALTAALTHGLHSQQPEKAITWFLEQVRVQQQQGRHQAVIPVLQFFLTSRQNIDISTALASTYLGKALIVAGEYDSALTALETARNQWQALQLDDSLEAATVELELAGVYLKLERIFDANKACQKALNLRIAQLDANSPAVAEVLNCQAEIAASQGNYREAVNLSERGLQILQSHPDTQPLQLAQLKYTAAWLNDYNNNLDAAEKLCQEALAIVIAAASDEHPLAISCQAMLGDIYQRMGQHKYRQALTQYQLALDIAELSLGFSHPKTLQLLQALVSLCRKMGDYKAADEFAERYSTHLQLANFEETAETARRLNNISYTLHEKGEYGKAEPLLQQALQIRMKVLGAEHPDTANSLNSLAVLYKSQGRYDEAEPLFKQALQIKMKVLGDKHPDTANSLNNLAFLYYSQGRYDEAEPLYNQALQIKMKVLGAEHPDTALTFNNLALLFTYKGRYDEAEPLYNQALQIMIKVLGGEHPDTATSLNNLAGLYKSQRMYDEAEPLLKQALQIKMKVLGDKHPDTANSLNNLAGLYESQERYDEAEFLYNQALQIMIKVLGAEHPHTKIVQENLQRLHNKMAES
ncbi:tetratricopeptide repeat protein [Nostoc piscinale]|uniref:tetratricopeptide repeat protein n=1 Tax=Nostoc piscinale TaxID=224012 RepID=UPI0007840BD0|nr:tetratricopeptide repeat protein [Nostoc piscinale]